MKASGFALNCRQLPGGLDICFRCKQPGPMGWISVVFVHKMITAAREGSKAGGQRRQDLFRSVGVDPEVPVDPKLMVPDADFFALLERLVEGDDHGRAIPVRIGASMRCDNYGAFGLAFKSATDLWGSYRRVERFGKVVTSIANFRVVPLNSTALMEVIPGRAFRLGLAMTNELAIAAATALSREVCRRDFSPVAVHFRHHAPRDTLALQGYFQCPVHYGAERDALEASVDLLSRPQSPR